MAEALKLVASGAEPELPYDRIREAINVRFMAPVVVPDPHETTLWGRRCAIVECEGWDSHGTPPVCAQHRHRLHYLRVGASQRGPADGAELPRESFIADSDLNGGPQSMSHPGFDFTGLPDRLTLELRLLVQERLRRRTTMLRRHEFATIKKWALAEGLQSLLVEGLTIEDRWMPNVAIPDAFKTRSGQVRAHVRFAVSLACDVGWPVPLMQRERWYEHDFVGDSEARTKTMTWTGIGQPWLKEWLKRWVETRLATGWKWNTAIANQTRMLWFSRFLSEKYPGVGGPQDLSRELLLQYIAWTRQQPRIAASQRQGLVSSVKVLIEDHRLNGWRPAIPETAILRQGELPKRDKQLPRPIDEFLLTQILAPGNLELAAPELRLILRIFNGHGLRISSIVGLPIDCLGADGDGFPTLRYPNTKRHRERLHPIRDPEIEALLRQQRERALAHHPTTPWLFPAIHSNAFGMRHTTTSAVRSRFYEYLKRIKLKNPDGSRAHVTPHQFRHTFGTRELNNGAPQEVVQELLDHDSPEMTRGYAQLSGKRLREEFVAAARFNASGDRLESLVPDSPLADLAWMKERMNRARVTLPNGYCGMPLQQVCEVQNACLDCDDYFITTPEFLPAHESQYERTAELIAAAEEAGRTRVAEKNRPVLIKLDKLIASLRSAP